MSAEVDLGTPVSGATAVAGMRDRLLSGPAVGVGSPRNRSADSVVTPTHLGFQFYLYGPALGRGSTSVPVARLSVLNGLVGVGLFVLADFFSVLGIPLGIVTLVIISVAARYSYHLLHDLSVRTQQLSYGQIALKISGPFMYFVVDIMILVNVLIAVCSIVIGIRDVIDIGLESVNGWIEDNIGIPQNVNILVWISAAFVLALCNTEKGSIPNRGVYVIIPYFIGLIVMISAHAALNFEGNLRHFFKCIPSRNAIEYLPVAVFTFDCFGQFMTIYAELPQPVPDGEADRFIDVPVSISLIFYILVTTVVTLSVDRDNPTRFLDRLDSQDEEYVQIFFAVCVIPFILLFAMKCAIWFRSITKTITFMTRVLTQPNPIHYLNDLRGRSNLIINTSAPSRQLIAISSTVIMAISACLAAVGANLEVVTSLLGAFVVVPLAFIIPPYLYILKLQNRTRQELRGPYLQLAFGIVMFLVCFGGVIYKLADDHEFDVCQ